MKKNIKELGTIINNHYCRYLLLLLITGTVFLFQGNVCVAQQSNAIMWEYQERAVNNPSWNGNEYDVAATVTFTHTISGSTHVTEMFYDGSNTWKFRFTGDKLGEWTYTTISSDSDLNGLTGSVIVDPNPDPDARGFLGNQGNKYAIQVGNNGELKAFRLNVYMNGEDFPEFIHYFSSDATINDYIADAKQYGFDTIFIHVCNNWFDFGSLGWDEHSSENPDPQTFEVLENLITIARNQGVHVHMWAWGDDEDYRKWTPVGVGGINGIPDQRVQRYIAARLGPLPGWTMGYGFDLHEWTSEVQLGSWASYMHQHFGWQHMLWGRDRYHSELDAKSYPSIENSNGNPYTYDDAVTALNTDFNRPHLYEERFWYMRGDIWTMEDTRRALWDYTLAGGMGAWWGFYHFDPPRLPMPPYPNSEPLATVNQFWADRFLLSMERANSLTDGHCLKTTTNDNWVFYKEDTDSIQMDLSSMGTALPAIAVNTKLGYAEIDIGTLSTTNQTWTAPYVSDWAIAVGNFNSDGEEEQGLVGYWTMDTEDISGTTLFDKSNSSNDGIIHGATLDTGQIGEALDFNGSSDYVTLSSNSVKDSSAFSIATWVKFVNGGTIYAEGYSENTNWAIFFAGSSNSARIIFKENGVWKGETKGTTLINDDGWHYVVVTQANKSYREIFIDGVLEDTNTETLGDMSILNTCNIGVLERTTFGSFFDGLIDDVQIYDYALTSEEITELFATGSSTCTENWTCTDWSDWSDCLDGLQTTTRICTDQNSCGTENDKPSETESRSCEEQGLVGYWTMDTEDISGTTLFDKSNSSNDGIIHGATLDTGQIGEALDFNGSSDYVTLSSNSVKDSSAFSIATWVKFVNGGTIYAEGYSENTNWAIFFAGSSNSARIIFKENGVWKGETKGTTLINDDGWHYVVVTQANKSYREIFIDGVLEDTNTETLGDMSILNTCNIGVLERTTFGSFFDGLIDDVQIYDYALTSEEILGIYHS